MIPRGQTDLTYGGTFFSLTVIYLLNLIVLAIFLIAASPGVTMAGFGHELLANTADLTALIVASLRALRL
jgi:hypothetical protein